jgi:transcriptional regulator with XRE-family HTH domain
VPRSARKEFITLGANIPVARLRRKLRAEIIAHRAGTTRQTVAKFEQGDPPVKIPTYVLRHAIRIVRYLDPRAYLSAASAFQLAPMRNGRLFISGPRNQRTRIRTLEINQNAAPDQPAVASVTNADGLGEFRTNVSSIRQCFLEIFRPSSEHAASINEAMCADIAQRLVAK